jgi:antitoxin ParD1/3/4
MPKLNISLTPELASLVEAKVSSGMYRSASEVVRDGLLLLREQDNVHAMRLEELKKETAVGTDQLNRGEVSVYASGKELAASIKAEGRKRMATRARAGS